MKQKQKQAVSLGAHFWPKLLGPPPLPLACGDIFVFPSSRVFCSSREGRRRKVGLGERDCACTRQGSKQKVTVVVRGEIVLKRKRERKRGPSRVLSSQHLLSRLHVPLFSLSIPSLARSLKR